MAVAAQQTDPIFALIEAHRATAKAYCDATAEYCRREQILVDEGIGRCHSRAALRLERRADVLGDAEDIMDAAGDAASEALDKLLSATPATPAGLLALITYLVEETEDVNFYLRGEHRIETLLFSIQDALRGQA
ncbi:hypothetical protein [Bradyrhizobium sp. 27S5]|uniref:hypothetical protein n=1 Tax=Bradyrhizobium sp. 27S5 TaxID=3139728 RepID=UPI0030CF965C